MGIQPQDRSDADLVVAAQNGCLESFGVLYERYHNPIVALAYAQLDDKHAAEDAAQEVFTVACDRLDSLHDRGKVGPWLAGICRNIARQMRRTRKRAAAEPEGLANERRSEDDEQSEAIRRAVSTLEPSERELIVMRYFDGFSQACISKVLDISPAAVNGRLVRAKRKLAQKLKREGFGS